MSRSRRPSPTATVWLGLALALLGCSATAPIAARVASRAPAAVAAAAPGPADRGGDGEPAAPLPVSTASPAPGPATEVPSSGPVTAGLQTTPPPTATPPTPPPSLDPPAPSAEGVKRAQRLLIARGADVGEVDGIAGDRTRAGVEDFQRAIGLPPTGALDPVTLARLEAHSASLAVDLPAAVVVDLSDQHLTVFNAAGSPVATWPVSTGGPGSETPTGTFTVQARQRTGQAEDAPTVHMDWFTVFNGDIGFHGIPWAGDRANPLWTPLGEAAVSHGCIRMDDRHAMALYTYLPDGAQVVVQA